MRKYIDMPFYNEFKDRIKKEYVNKKGKICYITSKLILVDQNKYKAADLKKFEKEKGVGSVKRIKRV